MWTQDAKERKESRTTPKSLAWAARKSKFLLTAKRLTEKRRDMGSKNLVLNRLGLRLGCRVGRWIMNLELWEEKVLKNEIWELPIYKWYLMKVRWLHKMWQLSIWTQALHHFRLSWSTMNKGDRQRTNSHWGRRKITKVVSKEAKFKRSFKESDQLCWILKIPGAGTLINDLGIWQHVDHCWPR